MNSAETVLEKYCPVFGNPFMDKDNKAMVDMRDSILKAMVEHSEQYRLIAWDSAHANATILNLQESLQDRYERISDLDDELTACKERNLSKDMKIQQLEAVINHYKNMV